MRIGRMLILLAFTVAVSIVLSDGGLVGALRTARPLQSPIATSAQHELILANRPVSPPIEQSAEKKTGAAVPLQLNFTYMERLSVPEGSTLSVHLEDARGANVYSQNVEVGENGPPYRVEIPLTGASAYPLQVSAKLTSLVGHKLTTQAELSSPDAGRTQPLDLVLSLQ